MRHVVGTALAALLTAILAVGVVAAPASADDGLNGPGPCCVH